LERRPCSLVCYRRIVLARIAPLLLLAMACAKAAPDSSTLQDARPSGADAAGDFADAGAMIDAGASACLPQVLEAYGTPPLLSTNQYEISGSYTFYAELVDEPFQRLFISLHPNTGIFAGAVVPGSYNIVGDETDYQWCGAC